MASYSQDGGAREDDEVKTGSTLVIPSQDLVSLSIDKLDLASKLGTGELKIDSAISKNHLMNLEGRDLQAVSSEWLLVTHLITILIQCLG